MVRDMHGLMCMRFAGSLSSWCDLCCAECHAIRAEPGAAHTAAEVHAAAGAAHGCAVAAHVRLCDCHGDCMDHCVHVAASNAVITGVILTPVHVPSQPSLVPCA